MTDLHVVDDLELYALGALATAESARIAEHLAVCPSCRAHATALAEVVGELPATVEPREPRPALRARILDAARADLAARAPRRRPLWSFATGPRLVLAGLASAVLVLGGLNVRELLLLQAAQSQKATYEQIVEKAGGSGHSWYMAGVGEWKGSGGTFYARQDRTPFVIFHDLKAVPTDSRYALWLVSPEGRWVRAASFVPDGSKLQTVDVDADALGFDRCVVTLEPKTGAPGGQSPLVMQSRIAPPSP